MQVQVLICWITIAYMTKLTIALLQLNSSGFDQEANLAKGEESVRIAAQMGADIALFPEMWNIGYGFFVPKDFEHSDFWCHPARWQRGEVKAPPELLEERRKWASLAIDQHSPFFIHFQSLARQLNIAIGLTYLEAWHPLAPRNSISLIDRHGEVLFTYAKLHTCDFDYEFALTPGNDFYVAALDTEKGPIQTGAMICYDREFPEAGRVLMLKGAELVLIPNACEMEDNRTCQLRTRAMENMYAVALANYAAPQEDGHSVAFDPIAFTRSGSRDTLVVRAGAEEGVYLAHFDLERLRDWREKEAWGNSFRKPHRYGLLTSMDVQEPFIRVNEKGELYPRQER